MNTQDTLTTIISHNLWANLKLLEACAGFSDEQLDARVIGAYGPIRDTFQHLVLAERGYFTRITTGQRYHRPEGAGPLTLAEMTVSARETGEGLIAWAHQAQPQDAVQINWDGVMRDVPKTIILNQVINHATEHRAQIMVIMTQLGIEPPSLDSWTYFDEQG